MATEKRVTPSFFSSKSFDEAYGSDDESIEEVEVDTGDILVVGVFLFSRGYFSYDKKADIPYYKG